MVKKYNIREHLVDFSEDRKWHKGLQLRCLSCSQHSIFDIRDKESFALDTLDAEFDAAMGEINIYEKDYCNGYCPHCLQPFRIVSSIVEFHMSSYYYYPELLLVYEGLPLMQLQQDFRDGKVRLLKGRPSYKKSLWARLFSSRD